jgi:hypothetical protein
MNAHPIPVSIHIPPYDLRVTGNDLALGVFNAFYHPKAFSLLPFVIYELRDGNHDVLIRLAEQSLPVLTALSRGMFYSVQCHDEATSGASPVISSAAKTEPGPNNFSPFRSDLAICAVWSAGKGDPVENQPVYSDIPTLILAGRYDPITPPRWGQFAAQTLSRSFFYEFPGLGHDTMTSSACPLGMAVAFQAPNAAPDASCIAKMPAPHFVARRDLYVTPAIYRIRSELLAWHGLPYLSVLSFCVLSFAVEVLLLPGSLIRLLRKRPIQNARVTWLACGLAVTTASSDCITSSRRLRRPPAPLPHWGA